MNYGYQQGFPAGQADRQDGWRSGGYQKSYAYQDGDYGYNGYYVNHEPNTAITSAKAFAAATKTATTAARNMAAAPTAT